MTTASAPHASGLRAGWILVTALISFCVLGTWFTASNYRQQVFSSAKGVVLENQWPESRIEVGFPEAEAVHLRPGQVAKITVGEEKTALQGVVLTVAPSKAGKDSTVIVKLTGEAAPGRTGEGGDDRKNHRYLPAGASCSVTIDTTVPPSDPAARETPRK
ncbi:MAG: hypothetical protein WAL87_08390 [Chthoniobacterales bacterium]